MRTKRCRAISWWRRGPRWADIELQAVPAVVDPGEAFEAQVPNIRVAQLPAQALRMIELAIDAGGELNPAGAQISKFWIGSESGFHGLAFIQAFGEAER